jgi:multisubunit Na+/H+ antiporter MnhC subunit
MGLGGENIIVVLILSGVMSWLSRQNDEILQALGLILSAATLYFFFFRKGEEKENEYGGPNDYSTLFEAITNTHNDSRSKQK